MIGCGVIRVPIRVGVPTATIPGEKKRKVCWTPLIAGRLKRRPCVVHGVSDIWAKAILKTFETRRNAR